MGNKLVIMLLLTVPAVADPAWFDKIHQKDLIAIVTPDGYCEAKVVSRGPDQITVRLKSTTSVCGARKSLVQVARRDVQDVVDDAVESTERGHVRGGEMCSACHRNTTDYSRSSGRRVESKCAAAAGCHCWQRHCRRHFLP